MAPSPTDDPPTPNVEEDDEYDDLDDVVSNFQSTTAGSSTRPRTNTRVVPPPNVPNAGEENTDETDFAKELARGMEELMKEIGGSSENLFAPPPNAQTGGGGSFQDTIKETMERLRASESGGSAGNAPGEPSLEALLASLNGLGAGGEGGGEGDEEIAGFIDHMMNAIITKDVLYEPLKELSEKYPAYLQSPPTPLGPKDLARYTSQSQCVAKIIAIFDEPGYSDEKEKEKGRVVELMSEMQSYGTPPEELIGEPIPGLGGEGMPEGCTVM